MSLYLKVGDHHISMHHLSPALSVPSRSSSSFRFTHSQVPKNTWWHDRAF